MKNIDYYLNLPYRLEIVPDIYEGGYVASYPELPDCLTCAETIEEVKGEIEKRKQNECIKQIEQFINCQNKEKF